MIALHVSGAGPIEGPLGVICRGGPVNGPFAAGALLSCKRILAERDIPIARIYANSGAVPAAALAAIGREDRACIMWGRLKPTDIIDVTTSWWSKAVTVSRLVRSESIFPATGLEHIIRSNIPAEELFDADSIPLSVMTVDYASGSPLVFDTRNPAFYPVIHEGILGSMALTPFLRLQVIWCGPNGLSPERQTGDDFQMQLMDGGFRDNLMIEQACRDGMKTLLVVDIHGLHIAPPSTETCKHWSDSLQRAFHALITTNDQRDLYGATRVNEELAIRDELEALRMRGDMTDAVAQRLAGILNRMNTGRLGLAEKHEIRVHLVSDPARVIPFDFADFKHHETEHLISAGNRAMAATLKSLR